MTLAFLELTILQQRLAQIVMNIGITRVAFPNTKANRLTGKACYAVHRLPVQ
jgi:hypothetical protein